MNYYYQSLAVAMDEPKSSLEIAKPQSGRSRAAIRAVRALEAFETGSPDQSIDTPYTPGPRIRSRSCSSSLSSLSYPSPLPDEDLAADGQLNFYQPPSPQFGHRSIMSSTPDVELLSPMTYRRPRKLARRKSSTDSFISGGPSESEEAPFCDSSPRILRGSFPPSSATCQATKPGISTSRISVHAKVFDMPSFHAFNGDATLSSPSTPGDPTPWLDSGALTIFEIADAQASHITERIESPQPISQSFGLLGYSTQRELPRRGSDGVRWTNLRRRNRRRTSESGEGMLRRRVQSVGSLRRASTSEALSGWTLVEGPASDAEFLIAAPRKRRSRSWQLASTADIKDKILQGFRSARQLLSAQSPGKPDAQPTAPADARERRRQARGPRELHSSEEDISPFHSSARGGDGGSPSLSPLVFAGAMIATGELDRLTSIANQPRSTNSSPRKANSEEQGPFNPPRTIASDSPSPLRIADPNSLDIAMVKASPIAPVMSYPAVGLATLSEPEAGISPPSSGTGLNRGNSSTPPQIKQSQRHKGQGRASDNCTPELDPRRHVPPPTMGFQTDGAGSDGTSTDSESESESSGSSCESCESSSDSGESGSESGGSRAAPAHRAQHGASSRTRGGNRGLLGAVDDAMTAKKNEDARKDRANKGQAHKGHAHKGHAHKGHAHKGHAHQNHAHGSTRGAGNAAQNGAQSGASPQTERPRGGESASTNVGDTQTYDFAGNAMPEEGPSQPLGFSQGHHPGFAMPGRAGPVMDPLSTHQPGRGGPLTHGPLQQQPRTVAPGRSILQVSESDPSLLIIPSRPGWALHLPEPSQASANNASSDRQTTNPEGRTAGEERRDGTSSEHGRETCGRCGQHDASQQEK